MPLNPEIPMSATTVDIPRFKDIWDTAMTTRNQIRKIKGQNAFNHLASDPNNDPSSPEGLQRLLQKASQMGLGDVVAEQAKPYIEAGKEQALAQVQRQSILSSIQTRLGTVQDRLLKRQSEAKNLQDVYGFSDEQAKKWYEEQSSQELAGLSDGEKQLLQQSNPSLLNPYAGATPDIKELYGRYKYFPQQAPEQLGQPGQRQQGTSPAGIIPLAGPQGIQQNKEGFPINPKTGQRYRPLELAKDINADKQRLGPNPLSNDVTEFQNKWRAAAGSHAKDPDVEAAIDDFKSTTLEQKQEKETAGGTASPIKAGAQRKQYDALVAEGLQSNARDAISAQARLIPILRKVQSKFPTVNALRDAFNKKILNDPEYSTLRAELSSWGHNISLIQPGPKNVVSTFEEAMSLLGPELGAQSLENASKVMLISGLTDVNNRWNTAGDLGKAENAALSKYGIEKGIFAPKEKSKKIENDQAWQAATKMANDPDPVKRAKAQAIIQHLKEKAMKKK